LHRRRRLYAGLDLSTTTDLTALVGVLPDDSGFDVIAQFFVPEESIRARSLRDRVPYEQFRRDGHLVATPGPTVDYEAVRRTLQTWAQIYDVQVVAYDPWNATDVVQRLDKQDGFLCVKVGQGFAGLSAPTKSLEQAILSKRLRHDGHPVLRWCVGNVAVEQDSAGNLKPSKVLSTERIDGVIALIMAVDAMDRNQRTRLPAHEIFVF
jgi:phage terminase large subunit-like protein